MHAIEPSQRFLITGAASGIGHDLARTLHRQGHRILATDLDESRLRARSPRRTESVGEDDNHQDGGREHGGHEHLQPGDAPPGNRRWHPAALDVRNPRDWERLLQRAVDLWGGLDTLLNVAGYLKPGEIRSATIEDVHLHFDVNVKGVVFGTRAAARLMKHQGSGQIVNIASLASLAPIPGMALYSASKYAVRGFSLAAAEELREHGITVTTVCPDAVATPMLDLQLHYPEAALTFTAPRILSTSEVTNVILKRVLGKRRRLVAFPIHRAWLARFADLFPASQSWLVKFLRRRGRKRQQALRNNSSRIE